MRGGREWNETPQRFTEMTPLHALPRRKFLISRSAGNIQIPVYHRPIVCITTNQPDTSGGSTNFERGEAEDIASAPSSFIA